MSEDEAIPVINHHMQTAIDLMRATGAGPDPHIWYELRVFIPPNSQRGAEALAAMGQKKVDGNL